jgi:YHS domain-containing protein
MRIDPVCNMTVKAPEALTSVYKATTHYVCCEACKKTFDRSPDEYVRQST